MPEPRAAVANMAPYAPPTGGRAGQLRLDFNENTIGCSPRVIEALTKCLTADRLSIYPEYAQAMRDLAAFFEVSEGEFTLTNGTDEAIELLIHTYVDEGDEVVLLRPSYAMYRFYAQLAGARVREIDYGRDLAFPFAEILRALRPSTRAVLLANPNNPTGSGADVAALEKILEVTPRSVVLIDEAYFEFCGVTMLHRIRDFANLFVSRTFSKVYGMAAICCGCLFSRAENMAWLRKAQSPYSVNMPAAIAARAAVTDREFVANYVREVRGARDLACRGLDRLGIRYFPSEANFVLFDAGARALEIRDALRERGVLVRDRSYEVPGCLRVTIGTRTQIERFLKELEHLWIR